MKCIHIFFQISRWTKTILSEYQKERENLYDLKVSIRSSLVKLETIFAKIEEVRLPHQRNRYIAMGKDTLDGTKNMLK